MRLITREYGMWVFKNCLDLVYNYYKHLIMCMGIVLCVYLISVLDFKF